MITRFLYNTLAFVYNKHVEIEGESLAYYTGLFCLSMPLSLILLAIISISGYQLKVFTGTKWDTLPFFVFLMVVLWTCFPKKKVVEHAQVATKREQKISAIIFIIVMYIILLLFGAIYRFGLYL